MRRSNVVCPLSRANLARTIQFAPIFFVCDALFFSARRAPYRSSSTRCESADEGPPSKLEDCTGGALSRQSDSEKRLEILSNSRGEKFWNRDFGRASKGSPRVSWPAGLARAIDTASPEFRRLRSSRATGSIARRRSRSPAQKNQCMISDFAKNFAWRTPPTLRNRANRPSPIRIIGGLRCRVWPSRAH